MVDQYKPLAFCNIQDGPVSLKLCEYLKEKMGFEVVGAVPAERAIEMFGQRMPTLIIADNVGLVVELRLIYPEAVGILALPERRTARLHYVELTKCLEKKILVMKTDAPTFLTELVENIVSLQLKLPLPTSSRATLNLAASLR